MLSYVATITKKWGRKTILSVADQGIMSGANFLLNIFLARWLGAAEYGAFVSAYIIFLFISGFANALVYEPISILGPKHNQKYLFTYLAGAHSLNNLLALSLGVVMVLMASWHPSAHVGEALWALSLTTPMILWFWYWRRVCYVARDPGQAFKASMFYSLFLLSLVTTSFLFSSLSASTAFFSIGISSVVGGLVGWLWYRKKKRYEVREADCSLPSRSLPLARHWSYGKWPLATNLVFWGSTDVYLLLVGVFVGLDALGAFRAIQILFMPLTQVLTALGNLLQPEIAIRRVDRNEMVFLRTIKKMTIMIITLSVIYVLAMSYWGSAAVRFLYGSSVFSEYLWLLPGLAVITVSGAITQIVSILLRVEERPDIIFWGYCGAVVITVTIGVALVNESGLNGAVVGLILSSLTVNTLLIAFVRRRYRRI